MISPVQICRICTNQTYMYIQYNGRRITSYCMFSVVMYSTVISYLFKSFKVVCESLNVPNNEGSADHRITTLPSVGPSGVLNVKEEDQSQPVMPPMLSPEGPCVRAQGLSRSLSNDQQHSVHMFVVKEEDPLVLNEPQIIQQPSNGRRKNGDVSTSTGKWENNISFNLGLLGHTV